VKSKRSADTDLQTQLESLLDQVWRSEAEWRLWDRVDALVLLEAFRAKRGGGQTSPTSPDSASENAA